MSKPVDRRAPRVAVIASSVAAAAAIVAAVAMAGAPAAQAALVPPPAGTTTPTPVANTPTTAIDTAPGIDAAPRGWQLRCWQQGRLLFEENGVQLPADASAAGLRLRGTDRHGAPVYVTDSQNATCLIRRETLPR